MKRIITFFIIFLSALFSTSSYGATEDVLDNFVNKVSSSLVTFSYTYSVNAKVKIQGSGNAIVQGEAFYMKGNGLEIWCNGKTRWTVDRAASEALIESVGAIQDDYETNPAKLISSVSKAFNKVSEINGTFHGKSVKIVTLTPKVRSSIRLMKLCFSGEKLIGAFATVSDGTVTEFVISNMAFKPKGSLAKFALNEKSLGKAFVITDLR
jgi:hypothetical protein